MANAAKNRPLSPHLQIYRPIPTMMSSIIHRITGSALYFGTVLVAWWLIAAASGPEHFATANWVFGSWIGQIVLFGFTWALVQHMLGGLRHLVWDLGYGFDKHLTTRVAKITFVAAPVITILLWIAGYMAR
jgi:succinate dehydrogenase / fumarate reductase cytochrome b subunit